MQRSSILKCQATPTLPLKNALSNPSIIHLTSPIRRPMITCTSCTIKTRRSLKIITIPPTRLRPIWQSQVDILQGNVPTWSRFTALKASNRISIYCPSDIFKSYVADLEERRVAIPCSTTEGCALCYGDGGVADVVECEVAKIDILDV